MGSAVADTYAKGDIVVLVKNEQLRGKNKLSTDFLLSEIMGYKLNMFRVAQSILSNVSDAEDAVSEGILTAYSSFITLRNRDSFKPWIMKIVVRECYKILKKRSRVNCMHNLPEIPVNDPDNTQVLWGYVNQLTQEFRSVVVLFYYEDMSIKDIAKTLSLPQGTVKSRLSRGKTKLKSLIEKDGGQL